MNGPDRPDEAEPSYDPSYDDPAFDEVRRLLADARATDPVPPEVVARLDDTLASLRAEQRDPSEAADPVVVPLRRRWAPMLAAAAAVVLVAAGGLGIAQAVRGGSTTSDSTAGGEAAGSTSADTPTVPGPVAPGARPETTGKAAAAQVPELSSDAFGQDAVAVMRTLVSAERAQAGQLDAGTPVPGPTDDRTGAGTGSSAPPVTAAPERLPAYATEQTCTGPQPTGAVTVPARLDGRPVALVFRAPTATAQQVEAWSCDGTTLLESASVPH